MGRGGRIHGRSQRPGRRCISSHTKERPLWIKPEYAHLRLRRAATAALLPRRHVGSIHVVEAEIRSLRRDSGWSDGGAGIAWAVLGAIRYRRTIGASWRSGITGTILRPIRHLRHWPSITRTILRTVRHPIKRPTIWLTAWTHIPHIRPNARRLCRCRIHRGVKARQDRIAAKEGRKIKVATCSLELGRIERASIGERVSKRPNLLARRNSRILRPKDLRPLRIRGNAASRHGLRC